MQELSRREFLGASAGAVALAGVAFGQAAKQSLPPIKSTFNGVVVGCNTYSFSQSSLDEAIKEHSCPSLW
jgi:hypothetical protein